MFYQFEHINSPEHFVIEKTSNFSFPIHIHQCFEIIILNDGHMNVTIDNKTYLLEKNDSILIFPNQLHSLDSTKSEHTLCIFSPTLVANFYKHNWVPTDNKMLFSMPQSANISNLFLKQALVYNICGNFETERTYVEREHSSTNEWLISLFIFINKNYKHSCKLKDAVVNLGYDYSYISKQFKQHLGISYNQYVNLLRIQDAQTLLTSTNKSITQIADECGYNSLRSFNRKFIEIVGITPTDYRIKQSKSHSS